jgi:hypothetical protein
MSPEVRGCAVQVGARDNGAMTVHASRLPLSLDALIAEAKRGARQRRFLLVGIALLLATAALVAFALRSSGGISNVPSYPRTGIVPPGVREIEVRSAFPGQPPAASLLVTRPATVGDIARLIDSLQVVKHPALNATCPADVGPEVTLTLRDGDGVLLASASVTTENGLRGLGAPCNPMMFARGRPVTQGLDTELTVRNHGQAPFVRQLQRLLGTALCQQEGPGAPAQSC